MLASLVEEGGLAFELFLHAFFEERKVALEIFNGLHEALDGSKLSAFDFSGLDTHNEVVFEGMRDTVADKVDVRIFEELHAEKVS